MNRFGHSRAVEVYTSSWFTPLPADMVRIGVSRGPPRGQRGYRLMRELAPGKWFQSASERTYIELYRAQLAELDPISVYRRMLVISSAAPRIALLCFEPVDEADQWCHRSLLATWLSAGLGIAVREWGYEDRAMHPLLPPSLRGV